MWSVLKCVPWVYKLHTHTHTRSRIAHCKTLRMYVNCRKKNRIWFEQKTTEQQKKKWKTKVKVRMIISLALYEFTQIARFFFYLFVPFICCTCFGFTSLDVEHFACVSCVRFLALSARILFWQEEKCFLVQQKE